MMCILLWNVEQYGDRAKSSDCDNWRTAVYVKCGIVIGKKQLLIICESFPFCLALILQNYGRVMLSVYL
jgi:hypothetical protein